LADVNSNININFDTTAALAQLRQLQAGLSKFHQSLAEGNLAAANAQKGLNAQLVQSVGATGRFSASQVKVAGSTLAFTSALEKNKLSLREYYRYTMAAATANTRVMGKAFAQEREIINRARRDRVKALQSQYIQMNKANAGFMDAIRIMPKSLQMAGGKFTELGTRIQYAAQRQQFLNQLLKQGSTQLLNFGKNTQWAGRQLMVGLTMPLALFGSSAAKTFRELEAEIVKFRRVYGNAFTNEAETNAAVENIRKLASEYTKYGVSVTKTMEMAGTAAAAGFEGAGLNAQVQTATKLAVLGQVEQQQALETTISLQNAFGLSSEDLAKKIDFLNAVENQTVLSIEDLTIAIPKAAPVIKQLGGNVEDLAFFMTAMKEGGINASEGANALKSGLASLINPSKKAAEFLADLGINVKGIVEGNQGDIKATVVGFARALDTLDPLNRARAIEQMFGKFQFARLSTLFQNVSKDGTQASRAFDLAGKSVEELAILSEREMKKIEESVGVKFQAAIEQFKQEIMPLGKAFLEALTPVVKFFGGLFEKFNELSDSTKKVIAIIVGAVAGIGPVLLMTFGLLANGVANVIKFFAMLRGGIAKLNGQTSVLGAGFTYMTQEQIESAAASQQLHQTHTRLIEVFNVEKASVNALAASYGSLATQMRSMAAANPSLFAGGAPGAARAVTKLPPVRKYKDGILSVPGPKGAGDVVPAMLSPGEAVIPTETTDKYRGLITAMFQDKVPGFMTGRLPGGPGRGVPLSEGPAAVRRAQQARYRRRDDARQGYNEPHPERKSGPTFIGMPKSARDASQSRQIVDKIANSVNAGRFGGVAPTDFGTLLQPFSGRSFPVRGVGGVYRKPNGQIVVVKPTIDDKTALAEVRATQIAREVHGLVAPKQTIRTMMDPTDPTGKRKFIVVESPYDPRIASMDGKFSKSDMVKQLVASTLRGDKDLQQPNLSGNVLADVGTAGVFDRASGFRDFSKAMPSMEQQAVVNLLGVKGGAKKFFAQETSGLAASMTPAQYDAAIKAEINRSIPRLEKVVKSFDLDPQEKVVYNDMIARLRAGADTDWAKLHPIHARAGEGIPKFELGNFEKLKNIPESKTQVDILTRRLAEDAAKELDRLPEEQKQRVLAAIKKQKPQPTHMSQNRLIKFVEDNMVYKDGLFHDKKSLDAGVTNSGKTYEEVMKKVFYQMGLKQKDGAFVSDKKINVPSKLKDALSPVNKAGGGWRTNIPKDSLLWKALDSEEQNFRAANMAAGKNDPLRAVREKLSALGYTEKQIARELRSELSHLEKTGESGRGPAKYSKGKGMFDLRILNNYMNTKTRPQNILDWNNKSGNPLGLSPVQLREFQKAADYMKPGAHPTTLDEIKLVQKSAQLDVLADEYLKQQKTKPKGFPKLGQVNASRGLLALLEDRIGTGYYNTSRPVFNLASGVDRTQSVLVDPRNEFKVDTVTGRVERLSTANTTPKPKGAVPSSGDPRDRRVTTESPTQRVATRSQVRRFGRMFAATPGFSMPGRVKGDPSLGRGVSNPTVRQGEIASQMRRAGYSQEEIDRTIRKIQKRELEAKQSAAQSAQKEAAAKKQQAETQKRQTDAAKKRFLENERRAELNRQMALNFDAAEKEDRQRTLNQLKQSQKEETKQRRMMRQQKIGGVSGGASMALGTAGMGLMMAGQQTAGMAAMGASAVAGMAPMLAGMGPVGMVTTAAVALGGSLFLLDRSAKKAAEAQSKLADSTLATTEKMAAIGELTGTVGASEIYARKRTASVSDRYTTGFERGKQQFGATFLESEVGSGIMSNFVDSMKSGTDIAAKQMAIQLAGYISDGVMSAEQAQSIASQIGINLNNQTLTSQISGQLLDLVGPSGEDLLTNPLEVRVRLVQEQRGLSTQLGDMFKEEMANPTDEWTDITARDNAKKMAASVAAMGVQNLEFNQAQIDSLNVQYDKELKILEAKKAATTDAAKRKEIDREISTLEGKRLSGTQKLRQSNEAILKDQLASFKVAQENNKVEEAFFDSLKSQVRTKAEATGQGAFADAFLNSSADLDSKELEVKINTIVASGQMPVATATSLMGMFAGKETELETFITATTKLQDPGKLTELINSLGGIEDKEVARTILADIATRKPKEADKLMATIALMQKMAGKEINIQAFFEQEDAMAQLEALQIKLEEVEQMPTPITKEAIALIDTDGNSETQDMGALLDVWDQWGNLPDETKKTVIQEYITLLSTITEGDVDAEIAAEKSRAPGAMQGFIDSKYKTPEARTGLKSKIAAERVMQATKQDIASKAAGVVTDDKEKGSKNNPLSFLDQLGTRLKNVRDNAFNALKPVDSLLAAFRDKKTQQNAFKLFDGIQNRLLKMGVGKDLRDAVASMSAEDFAKVAALKGKDALFTFQKGKPRSKDTITGLTQTGKAVDQGYREASIGEFNLVNEETVKNIQDQDKAYRMLIASGLTAEQALGVVADQGQAAALAAGSIKTSDPEWKKYIANIKQANDALERQEVLNRAIRANEEFKMYKEMPDLVSQMKELGYSTDQIDAVLGDPQLAKFLVEDLKDGKLDAKEIADYINSIEARKIIDIQVQLNKGDLAGAAAQGREIVDDLFAAQEALIRTGPEAMAVKANERKISDLEGQIAPFQRQIEELNDQIEDGQREIEKSYTRPIEELNEQVNDLNRDLEMNPLFGDRAIKKIQDENSILSNDLEIINNAADKVNKRYDEQAEALSKVQEINANILEQQKQQLGLADALTQGDISAAAQAAQDMRATSASQFASGQQEALDQARQNAIGSLVGAQSGLTAEQINEKQFQNAQRIYQMENDPRRLEILDQIQVKQDAIYALEEKREAALLRIRDLQDKVYDIEENKIEPLQEQINLLNYQNAELQRTIDKQIEGLRVLGKSRDEWDAINAKLDYYAATKRALENSAALAGLLSAAEALNLTWADILAKMAAYAKGVPGSVATAKAEIAAGVPGAKSDPIVPATVTGTDSSASSKLTTEQQAKLDQAKSNLEIGKNLSKVGGMGVVAKAMIDEAASTISILTKDVAANTTKNLVSDGTFFRGTTAYRSAGGLIPKYFNAGGFALGTDTVPAMLSPGEFVMSKYAVQSYGIDKMKSINNGSSVGDSVYNYSISVNVTSDANPDDIARVVMTQIRNVDSQKLRGARF
jgi:TP901 family phage tail tape measure protein